MERYYLIICPHCGKHLAVTKEEAESMIIPNTSTILYRYTCLTCKIPALFKESQMQPLDQNDPKLRQIIEEPVLGAPPETEGDKRLGRIGLTINHFRSYQYGEPYEGRPVAMRRAFDIEDADAEVILLGLDVLKELQELDDSLDAAVNFRVRQKKMNDIIEKMKDGIKV